MADIITTAVNFNNMRNALNALMTVYYSGSIGVQVFRSLMVLNTSDDANALHAAHAEIAAFAELGMLDCIRPQIPGIIAAVIMALHRIDSVN